MNGATMIFDVRQMMFNEGFQYLLDVAKDQGKEKEINEQTIRMHLDDWKNRKPKEINGNKDGLFYKMIDHARNRNALPKIVGNLEDFEEILCNFDPERVIEKYNKFDKPWNNLLDDIEKIRNLKNINRKKGFWIDFSRSILTIADFLSEFNTIHEFDEFVDLFNKNDNTRIALALFFDSEISGYGFALACDFLKENCNQEYVKPDRHIMKLFTNSHIIKELDLSIEEKTDTEEIEMEIEISKAIKEYSRSIDIYKDPDIIKKLDLSIKQKLKNKNTKKDIEIFRAMIEYSRSIDKLPYEIDKLFWLVGSGNFYLMNISIKTSMDDFIKRVIEKFPNDLHIFYGVTTPDTLIISGGRLTKEEAMIAFINDGIINSPDELYIKSIRYSKGLDPYIETDDLVIIDTTVVTVEWNNAVK